MSTTTLLEDLTSLRTIENGLTQNKVANFAYTDVAYENNEVNGVEEYSPASEGNIPIADASVLKVNPTVLAKGWRSQASSLTRMLMNHFLGRLSYNLNKVNDIMSSLLSSIYSHYGTANGFATLDSNGRIPYSQLPESALEYKGDWNAETNTPALADGTGDTGDMYLVSVAGTQDLGSGEISFLENDRVIYNGSVWQKLSGGSVLTVNNVAPDSATGNVELTKGNIGLENVVNTADSDVPEEDGTKKFTSGGAYDFFAGCTNAKDWLAKIFGLQLGRYWKTTNISTSVERKFNRVIVNANGLWLVGRDSDGIYWSEDGKNWTKGTGDLINRSIYDIKYANNMWVAVGLYGAEGETNRYSSVYWSTDGKSWTRGNGDFFNGSTHSSIAYANGLWVVGGSGETSANTGVYWSTDGKNWTKGSGMSARANRIIYNNGLWVSASQDNGVWWSEDGKNWTQGIGISSSVNTDAVAYADGIYVTADTHYSSGKLYWSTDGKNWTAGTSVVSVFQVYNVDGLWVAIASGVGIYYSLDGKNWTHGNGIPSAHTFFHELIYANGLFIVVNADTGIWRSEDGINWSQVSNTLQHCYCIAYKEGFCLVGTGTEDSGLLTYSDISDYIKHISVEA